MEVHHHSKLLNLPCAYMDVHKFGWMDDLDIFGGVNGKCEVFFTVNGVHHMVMVMIACAGEWQLHGACLCDMSYYYISAKICKNVGGWQQALI